MTGSDRRVYAYEPDEEKFIFTQVPVQKYFPELEGQFSSTVTRLQIECISGLKKRITLVGCEDGTLTAFIVSDSESSIFSIPSSPVTLEKKEISGGDTGVTGKLNTDKDIPTDNTSESGDSASLVSSMNEDLDLGQSIQRYTHHFDGMITSIQFYTDGFSVNAIVSSANSPVYVYTWVVNTDKIQSTTTALL